MADPVPGPVDDDPAAVGFALLMAGVETAVASAAEEIAALGQMVQQGVADRPPLSPPKMPGVPPLARKPADTAEPSAPRSAMVPAQSSLPAVPSEPVAQPFPAPQPPRATTVTPPGYSTPATVGSPAPAAVAPLRVARSGATASSPTQFAAAAPASLQPSALPATAAPAAPFGQLEVSTDGREPAARSLPPRDWAAAPPAQSGVAAAPVDSAPSGSPLVQPDAIAPSASQGRSLAPTGREGARSSPSNGGGDGAMHGDVFLDGVRVGHWMSETLARAAGGPARGGTAFDPRMGPRWPGALQGQ